MFTAKTSQIIINTILNLRTGAMSYVRSIFDTPGAGAVESLQQMLLCPYAAAYWRNQRLVTWPLLESLASAANSARAVTWRDD